MTQEPIESCHLCGQIPKFVPVFPKVEAYCHNGRLPVANIDISHVQGEAGTIEFRKTAMAEAIRIWNQIQRGEKMKLEALKSSAKTPDPQ